MKFQKGKGHRIKKYGFFGISAISDDECCYWYCDETRKWLTTSELEKATDIKFASDYLDCKSLKAAVRKIKKSNVPKGTRFTLESRFVGYDIEIIKK